MVDWNRRQWMAAGLGLCTAARARSRVDRAWISAITDEIARSPEDAIAFARQYGLSFVELRSVPGARRRRYEALPRKELESAARQLRDAGLKVSFLNAGLLKHMLPGTEPVNPRHRRPDAAKRFAARMELLGRALEAAQILGVDKVRVFTFHRVKDPLALLPRIAEIIAPMAETAGRAGITLLVENEASCNVATSAELAALMKLLPSRWVGINWDPLNGTRYGETPMPDGYRLLPKDRIGNVQIKGKSILPGWHQLLPWRRIFDVMAADGYRGKFGLETHIFGEGQIQASHDSMKQILRILES